MKNNIETLYKQVNDKHGLILELSEYHKIKPLSISKHWFSKSGFWAVPEIKMQETVSIMQKWIAKEKEALNKLEVESPKHVK